MRPITKYAIIALGIAAATSAHAQQGLYAGADLSQINYKESSASLKTLAVVGKLGYKINDNVAVEGRLGTGVSSDSFDDFGTKVKVETDNLYGVYVKGMLPIADVASVYGLVGYTHGKLSNSSMGSTSDGGLSYGAGAEFAITKQIGLNLEWAHLYKGDGYKTRALTLGVSYQF